MTKAQFITAIAAEPNFVKWAQVPEMFEKVGDIEKWRGYVYRTTVDGANLEAVVFVWDSATDTATWQTGNTLSPTKNTNESRVDRLMKYLADKANFFAFKVITVDPDNFWAIAEVYTESGVDLAKSTVLVYKPASTPITHKKIV